MEKCLNADNAFFSSFAFSVEFLPAGLNKTTATSHKTYLLKYEILAYNATNFYRVFTYIPP